MSQRAKGREAPVKTASTSLARARQLARLVKGAPGKRAKGARKKTVECRAGWYSAPRSSNARLVTSALAYLQQHLSDIADVTVH